MWPTWVWKASAQKCSAPEATRGRILRSYTQNQSRTVSFGHASSVTFPLPRPVATVTGRYRCVGCQARTGVNGEIKTENCLRRRGRRNISAAGCGHGKNRAQGSEGRRAQGGGWGHAEVQL